MDWETAGIAKPQQEARTVEIAMVRRMRAGCHDLPQDGEFF
jgi:hypothetical protein